MTNQFNQQEDLFSSAHQPLTTSGDYFSTLNIDDSWRQVLAPIAPDINAMGDFLAAEQAAGYTIAPPEEDRWRAFRYPFDKVTVLIVGQDPYPTPGHAMGLSFSLRPEVKPLAKSLVNIFAELQSDLGVDRPRNGDLSAWSDQGVMLLNRVLSGRAQTGGAGSHRKKGWEKITDHVITSLVNRGTPLVAILWGKDAQSLSPLLSGHPNVKQIKSVHPSPLSASRGFFGSRPFTTANYYLGKLGAPQVNWAL